MNIKRIGLLPLAGLLAAALFLAEAAEIDLAGQEEFLLTAKILKTRNLSTGITQSMRGTLSNGQITHDASIQDVDIFKQTFTSALGTEFNFKDTYKANIAAYRLAKMLGLEKMTPPSIQRRIRGNQAAFTWWVDDTVMTEKDRFFKKEEPPNLDSWNKQMHIVRAFDQLIYNMDRNLGNLVIDKDWNLHMIDHTRAFRLHKKLKSQENLVRCDRKLFAALQALEQDQMRSELSPFLNKSEINAILARRDLIVELFEKKAAQQGDETVFYDYLATQK